MANERNKGWWRTASALARPCAARAVALLAPACDVGTTQPPPGNMGATRATSAVGSLERVARADP